MVGIDTRLMKQCKLLGIPVCNATGKIIKDGKDYYPLENRKSKKGFYEWEDPLVSQCIALIPPPELLQDRAPSEMENVYRYRNEDMQYHINEVIRNDYRKHRDGFIEALRMNYLANPEQIKTSKFTPGTFNYYSSSRQADKIMVVKVLRRTANHVWIEVNGKEYRKRITKLQLLNGEKHECIKFQQKNAPNGMQYQDINSFCLFKPRQLPIQACKTIQRAWRKCRYTPKYTMCHKVQIRMMEDDGYEFSD